jgi:hypothetical protein
MRCTLASCALPAPVDPPYGRFGTVRAANRLACASNRRSPRMPPRRSLVVPSPSCPRPPNPAMVLTDDVAPWSKWCLVLCLLPFSFFAHTSPRSPGYCPIPRIRLRHSHCAGATRSATRDPAIPPFDVLPAQYRHSISTHRRPIPHPTQLRAPATRTGNSHCRVIHGDLTVRSSNAIAASPSTTLKYTRAHSTAYWACRCYTSPRPCHARLTHFSRTS